MNATTRTSLDELCSRERLGSGQDVLGQRSIRPVGKTASASAFELDLHQHPPRPRQTEVTSSTGRLGRTFITSILPVTEKTKSFMNVYILEDQTRQQEQPF